MHDIALTIDQWLELQTQLENPATRLSTDIPSQAQVDASRTYCIFLAALKRLDRLDDALRSALAKDIEKQTLEFKPQESHSIRGLFIGDVATNVRTLLLLDRTSALTLLDSKFSSDWYHAPEEIKADIKEIVLKASNIMLQGFLKTKNENELLEIVKIFNRPAVSVSILAWLALHYLKSEYSQLEQQTQLLQLGHFINQLKPLLAESLRPGECDYGSTPIPAQPS